MIHRVCILTMCGIFGLSGCGQKAPQRPVQQNFSAEGIPPPVTGLPEAASLTSFETHVYEPILARYCSDCHAETFAPKEQDGTVPAEIERAHKAFLQRISPGAFAGVEQTLLVTKMEYKTTNGHNCWEPEAKKCYDKMKGAIDLWIDDLKKAGFSPTPVKYPNTTSEVAMSSATPITLTPDANQDVAVGVTTATLAAPFVKMTDDVDGAIKDYATTPDTTVPLAGNAANVAQVVTFNADVKAPGTYYAWLRVKTKAAANSRFFVAAGAGNPAAVPVTPGATSDWKWIQVTTTANNVTNPLALQVAAAGLQPVRVLYRDPGAKINQIVLTQRRDDFNGDQFVNEYREIKVPLNVPGAEGATLVATVWEQNKTEGKKALGVKSLRIVSAKPLHVKNIKPLVNGLFHANHGTYTIVDTTAGGANEQIATGGSTSTTWLADIATDKIAFSFEVIEVAK